MRTLTTILLGLLIIAILGSLVTALLIGADYRPPNPQSPDTAAGRIYPGVTVAGVDVGSLRRSEARAKLDSTLPDPDQTVLTIQVGDQAWQMTWSVVGQSYDIDAAVDAAYRVGTDKPWWLGALHVIRPLATDIQVPLIPADVAQARAYVEKIAERVELAPQDATLTLAGGEIRATPGREGQTLDVEAATAQVLAALADGDASVALSPTPIPARIMTLEPGLSEAQALLDQPLTLVIDDPLIVESDPSPSTEVAAEETAPPTGYHAEHVAERDRIAGWLRVVEREDRFHIAFDVMDIRAWVATIAAQMGTERTLDVDETTARMAQALRAGDAARVAARVRHPASTYIVEPGDTFFDIAYNHGFPQWHLEKANPDVDPGLIDAGQELVVPSIDTLFPHPLVENKRIEIHLPTQTLRAFEDDDQVFELKISSGISTTPTLAGQFQILFKEEMAFAPRWHLDMPYFMGFYEEREGFFNGIHELPITAYGLQLSRGVLGYPASYGCIIVDEGIAQELFDWAEVGTLVRVIGVAPGTPFGRQTLQDIAPQVEEPES